MTMEKKFASFFGLSGDKWLKHANPWSVWTRFITLPFIALSIWSRDWIGWYSLIPIVSLFLWLYINPLFFDKPRNTKSWSSRCVIGEKMWANRDQVPIPNHHKAIIYTLSLLQIVGVVFLAVGLYQLLFWPSFIGVVVIYLSKMWFLDRMVWLCQDMKNREEYKKLLY